MLRTKHVLLAATLSGVFVATADLWLRRATFGWSESAPALLALALLVGVFANYYSSPAWRWWMNAAALGLFVAALLVGDGSAQNTGLMPSFF